MAPPRGPKDSGERSGSWLFAFGRLIGFVLTGGLAVALIAAVVLVPAYARLARARYERDRERARTDDLKAVAAAQERMIAELPHDKVLTARLLMSQEKLSPADRAAYEQPTVGPSGPPGLIQAARHPRPAPPPDWLVKTSARLEKPSTRRGLLLLATGSLVVALFLFSPPASYRRREDETP